MESSTTTIPNAVDRPRYRADIDGLRAIAVAAVVAYHAGIPGMRGGYFGVDIFFVISGFLITALLVDEIADRGGIAFTEFYARRARRLLPAMTVMLVSVLILGRLSLSVLGEQQSFAKSAIATVLFGSNFFFMRSTGGYFDPAALSQPLLHTWSLGVEEQFYVVWPLLVHTTARIAGGGFANFEKKLRSGLMIVLGGSMGAALWLAWTRPDVAFYMMPPRAWEFAVGGLIALNARPLARLSATICAGMSSAGVAAIVVSVVLLNERTPFLGIAAILPVVGAAAVIAAGVSRHKTAVVRILSSRVFVFVGLVSYPWYLWHWPLLVLGRGAALGHQSLARDVGVALLSLLFAIATYQWVERPFRRAFAPRLSGRRRTLAGALIASAAVLAVALGVGYGAQAAARAPLYRALYDAKKDRPSLRAACGISRSPVPQAAPLCTSGDSARRRQIALWGDSNAEHFMPLLEIEGDALSVAILERSRSACPPLAGVIPLPIHALAGDSHGLGASHDCIAFNDAVLDEFRRGDTARTTVGVVIAARWSAYLGKDSPFDDDAVFDLAATHEPPGSPRSIELMATGLASSLTTLASMGVRVVVIAPTPFLPFSGPDCLATHSSSECRVSRREVERLRAPALNAVRGVVVRFPNVRLWDPIDGLCDAEYCAAKNQDVVVYRDSGHLTPAAARALDPRARSMFEWLVGGNGASTTVGGPPR